MGYKIMISPKAMDDLDEAYSSIAELTKSKEITERYIANIEEAIFTLERIPKKGGFRKYGKYAGKKYRQIFVNKYTIVYRIDENVKEIIIITIRPTACKF